MENCCIAKCFYFIGGSGAGKAHLPSPACIPPSALWCRLSHQAIPTWAGVSSHPYGPPDPSDSGPRTWDDTWPGGSEKQNNTAHNSSVSFIPRSCTQIPLHLSSSSCREVLHLISVWNMNKINLSLLGFVHVKLIFSYFSVIFMLYSNVLYVIVESIQKMLYIDMPTMHKLILGGQ